MKAWALQLQSSIAGFSPEEAALLFTLGLVLGVFPIVGCPTVLCLLAAMVFRLNPLALQLLNNIASPLQIALLLPLARVGQKLCGGAVVADGAWTNRIGVAALHAVTGWACICVPLGAVLYAGLLMAMRKRGELSAATAGLPRSCG